ncbi:MAG: tRNA uridine-5-carboxymethylaminomethyl(34) synthesis enzyme MnmG, partial [Porticoccaceae bacterium]|nr:tRNA uridine-5-carboxymethylaminomethyl(34) synthesis enzyme MnmG [Porticoccaceae bacterium]
VQGREPWCPRRDEAYLGVLVDDLITMGTREPYRMFTSRAEYRLVLREDNADLRLTEQGRQLGVVDDQRWASFSAKREAIDAERQRLRTSWVQPGSDAAEQVNSLSANPLTHEYSLFELLKRPELDYALVGSLVGTAVSDAQVAEQVEIEAKYAGYIDRQREEIERLRLHEHTAIPTDLDYSQVKGLSNEVRQKLDDARPDTLARASRIPGVTPAAISLLMIYLKKRAVARKAGGREV